jgi:hypothetical protein
LKGANGWKEFKKETENSDSYELGIEQRKSHEEETVY